MRDRVAAPVEATRYEGQVRGPQLEGLVGFFATIRNLLPLAHEDGGAACHELCHVATGEEEAPKRKKATKKEVGS